MKITRAQLRHVIRETLLKEEKKAPCTSWLEYMKTHRSDEWNKKSDAGENTTQGDEWELIYTDAKADLQDECVLDLDSLRREDADLPPRKERKPLPIMSKIHKLEPWWLKHIPPGSVTFSSK